MGTYRPKNRALISAWSLVACNPALEPLEVVCKPRALSSVHLFHGYYY